MKVLVTGGAGFIGSHLCESLIKRGDQVVCIDNFNDYYDPKLKQRNISQIINHEKFFLYKEDINNLVRVREIFKNHRPERIVHLAARAGVRPSISNPYIYQETNVKGTLNLLELSKEFKVKNFIFGSSSSIYGSRKTVPFSEDDRADNPISPYAATKKSGEELCYCYHHLHDLKITCLRFFTVYGPRGRPDMAPFKFTDIIANNQPINMYGDGTSKRDYTYVSDIIEGIISALDKEIDFEIINLGNSQPIELKYFISLIEKNLNKKASIVQRPSQPGDVPITFADISKAQKLLNYNPKVSIEEGIKLTVNWYQKEVKNEN